MKNKIIIILISIYILSFSIINIILEDREISSIERRKLTLFPDITLTSILDNSFMDRFEQYTLDQFPFRDKFLELKTYVDYNLFKRLDSNDLFTYDNHIYKLNYPLNEKEVYKFTEKVNYLYETYLNSMNVYYSVIPDKNYFLTIEDYPKIDYEKMLTILNKEIKNLSYINIIDSLNINDYYFTDLHWKQENLDKIALTLSKEMNFDYVSNFTFEKDYYPFYGSYYGNGFNNIPKDTIKYLYNEAILNAKVTYYEDSYNSHIYNEEQLGGLDSYNVFLNGPSPFIEIINENALSNKELIIFRDSFTSSLAPLLVNSYSKISLIDLRYMPTSEIESFLEFNNQDVLFLYNTSIINNSSILK